VNGLGIWSTTLENSEYLANARFRHGRADQYRHARSGLRLEELLADLLACCAGELVVQYDQVGLIAAAIPQSGLGVGAISTR